jgi:hypothetical protein
MNTKILPSQSFYGKNKIARMRLLSTQRGWQTIPNTIESGLTTLKTLKE